jgi:hypothetical protein
MSGVRTSPCEAGVENLDEHAPGRGTAADAVAELEDERLIDVSRAPSRAFTMPAFVNRLASRRTCTIKSSYVSALERAAPFESAPPLGPAND